jgi:hypothetical protein
LHNPDKSEGVEIGDRLLCRRKRLLLCSINQLSALCIDFLYARNQIVLSHFPFSACISWIALYLPQVLPIHFQAAAVTGGNLDNPMSFGNGPWPPTLPTAEQQDQAGQAGLRMDVDGGEINRLYLPAAGAIHIDPAIAGFQRSANRR